MCTEKYAIVKKKCLKMSKTWILLTNPNRKVSPRNGNTLTLTLKKKKKFWAQQSQKKGMLTVFWNTKGPITINFLEKCAFFCQLFR